MEYASQTEGPQTQPASEAVGLKPATTSDHITGGDRLRELAQVMNGSPVVQRLQSVSDSIQRKEPEEEELLQPKSSAPVQANKTGLPDNLKSGIESLSGLSMDHVQVHRNSSKPAQLNAHAFAQGSDIHLAPGQEQHLPHEAWHVVQQAQGRVKPTMQMQGGVPVNDDVGLEREADVMGSKALSTPAPLRGDPIQRHGPVLQPMMASGANPLQLRGVTLGLVMQAIGTGFRPTAGGAQQTSDDMAFLPGIVCHFSVLVASPGKIHISYYPADDEDYKRKIMHFGFDWNPASESFGPPAQNLGQWKPFRALFARFSPDAVARMAALAERIRQLLNAPPPAKEEHKAVEEDVAMAQDEGGDVMGADFIPVPDLGADEGPVLGDGQRYFGGPFPKYGDHEESPLLFKRAAGDEGLAPVQRVLEIAHDEDSDEEMELQQALDSVFLNPPAEIAEAVAAMRANQAITIRIGFSDHVGNDDFGFTQVNGNEINVYIDPGLQQTDDEPEPGEGMDNVTRETELQSTVIHELILHTIPAFQRLIGGEEDDDELESREHGSVEGWSQVLGTAESVNTSVLFNSIVDALKHSSSIAALEKPVFYALVMEAIGNSGGAIQIIFEGANLYIYTDVDCAHFVQGPEGYALHAMYDTDQFLAARAAMQDEGQDEAEGDGLAPDFIPLPDVDEEEFADVGGDERYFGGAFPPHGDFEEDSLMFKLRG